MASFVHFIKTEREKREWTQTEFGAKIGINSSAISRIENGTQKFSKSKLKTFCHHSKMERHRASSREIASSYPLNVVFFFLRTQTNFFFSKIFKNMFIIGSI